MKYKFSTSCRLYLKRALFGAVIIPYNLVVTVAVSLWLALNGVCFGSVRRLTSPRRWVFYPTFSKVNVIASPSTALRAGSAKQSQGIASAPRASQ